MSPPLLSLESLLALLLPLVPLFSPSPATFCAGVVFVMGVVREAINRCG